MSGMAWLLDTNILSELVRNPRGPLTQRLAGEPPGAICTSIIVACELRFGARRKGSAALTERVEKLLAAIWVLPFDEPCDDHYADIRAALERAGTPIGSHDLFIAAHARSRELTLVTHSLWEFERVPGLKVQDWLTGPAGPCVLTPRGRRRMRHRLQAAVHRAVGPPTKRRSVDDIVTSLVT
jgi:tRNA(fMet)-specific endonuclease VapC